MGAVRPPHNLATRLRCGERHRDTPGAAVALPLAAVRRRASGGAAQGEPRRSSKTKAWSLVSGPEKGRAQGPSVRKH